MRFSIETLLAVTTAVAVTLVCMLYPVTLLASAYFFCATGAILVAIVAAIQLQGRRRAFATSFAIVAAGYLWLAMPSWQTRVLQAQLGGSGAMMMDSPLLTTTLLYYWYELVGSDGSSSGPGGWTAYPLSVGGLRSMSRRNALELLLTPNLESFLAIGHSVFAMAFGYVGGLLGCRLHAQSNDLARAAGQGR